MTLDELMGQNGEKCVKKCNKSVSKWIKDARKWLKVQKIVHRWPQGQNLPKVILK